MFDLGIIQPDTDTEEEKQFASVTFGLSGAQVILEER